MIQFLMKTGIMSLCIFDKKIIVCAFLLITIITACVKNKTTPPLTPSTSSIGEIVKGGSNLTIFDSALSKAGLFSTLDSANPASVAAPFTVFAPVDMAFTQAGFTDSTVYKYTKDSLINFLKYYIYSGSQLTTATLPKGPNAPLRMIYGDTVFITVSNGIIYI